MTGSDPRPARQESEAGFHFGMRTTVRTRRRSTSQTFAPDSHTRPQPAPAALRIPTGLIRAGILWHASPLLTARPAARSGAPCSSQASRQG